MRIEEEYLTDEELDALILSVEAEGLVQAPAGVMEQVMEELLPGETLGAEPVLQKDKVVEFRRYCLRVITSVAAAVILMFALPGTIKMQENGIPTRESVLGQRETKTREQVLGEKSLFGSLGNSRFLSESIRYINVDDLEDNK